MSRVIDASSVAAYLLGTSTEDERDAVLDEVHSPALVDVEVTHTLRGLVRGGKLDIERAEIARDELAQLGLRRHPDASLLRRAWELRNVCTTYDGLYVALAEALDVGLVTRDHRLARSVGGLVDVQVVGN